LRIVHGITVAGVTILLLLMEAFINQNRKKSIISNFYFLLTSIQYLMFIFLFKKNLNFDLMIKMLIIIPIEFLIGSALFKK
jgi:hypothetical protein